MGQDGYSHRLERPQTFGNECESKDFRVLKVCVAASKFVHLQDSNFVNNVAKGCIDFVL